LKGFSDRHRKGPRFFQVRSESVESEDHDGVSKVIPGQRSLRVRTHWRLFPPEPRDAWGPHPREPGIRVCPHRTERPPGKPCCSFCPHTQIVVNLHSHDFAPSLRLRSMKPLEYWSNGKEMKLFVQNSITPILAYCLTPILQISISNDIPVSHLPPSDGRSLPLELDVFSLSISLAQSPSAEA